jgi:hypothetical protein
MATPGREPERGQHRPGQDHRDRLERDPERPSPPEGGNPEVECHSERGRRREGGDDEATESDASGEQGNGRRQPQHGTADEGRGVGPGDPGHDARDAEDERTAAENRPHDRDPSTRRERERIPDRQKRRDQSETQESGDPGGESQVSNDRREYRRRRVHGHRIRGQEWEQGRGQGLEQRRERGTRDGDRHDSHHQRSGEHTSRVTVRPAAREWPKRRVEHPLASLVVEDEFLVPVVILDSFDDAGVRGQQPHATALGRMTRRSLGEGGACR